MNHDVVLTLFRKTQNWLELEIHYKPEFCKCMTATKHLKYTKEYQIHHD